MNSGRSHYPWRHAVVFNLHQPSEPPEESCLKYGFPGLTPDLLLCGVGLGSYGTTTVSKGGQALPVGLLELHLEGWV